MDDDDDDYRSNGHEEDEDDNDGVTNGNGTAAAAPVESERLTVHSYGALDVSGVEDECWLIRIPPAVYECWDKASEGTALGDLIFTKGGTDNKGTIVKPSITIQLDATMVGEQLDEEEEKHEKMKKKSGGERNPGQPPKMLPLHYSLQAMTKKVPVMHPFVRNPVNGKVQLLGTVSRTANLQVERGDTNYRTLLKDRVLSAITTVKFVKPVEATESILTKQQQTAKKQPSTSIMSTSSSSSRKSFGDAVYQYGKRKLEALQDSSSSIQSKKSRQHQFAPDQPMRSVIFELFQQQQHWTVKDLKIAAIAGGAFGSASNSKKLDGEIRDTLKEIGEYHRSGDHKNKWELRKEFQSTAMRQSSSSTIKSSASATSLTSGTSQT